MDKKDRTDNDRYEWRLAELTEQISECFECQEVTTTDDKYTTELPLMCTLCRGKATRLMEEFIKTKEIAGKANWAEFGSKGRKDYINCIRYITNLEKDKVEKPMFRGRPI